MLHDVQGKIQFWNEQPQFVKKSSENITK